MAGAHFYPIGKPGEAWGDEERKQWLSGIAPLRSYADEVLAKLEPLKERFDVEQYGVFRTANRLERTQCLQNVSAAAVRCDFHVRM